MCIKIHFYLFATIIYFYATHRLKIFLLFYVFAFLHECIHVLTSLTLKIKIEEILFLPVGVCAKYYYIDNKIKEIIIAFAGPLFSFLIGVLSKNLMIKSINFLIAFLNLIPIYPLDGGRIFRGILEIIFGYRKGIIFCNYVSKMFLMFLSIGGIILAVYFRNYSLLALDGYVFIIIEEELKKERVLKTINSIIGE